ncbi:MAG: elongation factor P [Calditrichaeota bacterium]|nr:MAG: elongation factor P [Calditrichota bacterium]
MKIKAIQIRKGNVLEFRGDLYRVTEATHVTPGKGQALMQVKMKRLSDGTNAEHRFRPDEHVEKATLITKEFQYLYQDGDNFYFMDMQTYEQIALTRDMLDEAVYYLLPETMVQIQFHGNNPVGVELPASVELKVVETEPNLKGATATGSYKPATLETGLVVQIPPYIEEGAIIRVDTRDGKYLDRVK